MSTDSIIARATAKRDAALAEAKRWDEWICMYVEVAEAKHVPQHVINGVAGATRRAPVSGALAETEAAVVAILTATGHPMPTRDLQPALAERGIEIGGKDPISTLSARLSRAPQLVNIRQRGWWIKERADDADPGEGTSSALFEHRNEVPVEPPSGPVEPEAGGGT